MNDTNGRSGHERCGGRTRQGTPCKLPAGHGTDHPGVGRCDHHGGATPTHRAHAERVLAERAEASALADLHRLGVEPVGSALDALAELAAEARQWEVILRRQVASLESLSSTTPAGVEQIRSAVILYERALDRAASFAALCARFDVEQRIFRLQTAINEELARKVGSVFERSLRQMRLTEEQWALAREAFPRELEAVMLGSADA